MFIGFGFRFMQSVKSFLWRYGTILGLPDANLSPCHMAFISSGCASCATSGMDLLAALPYFSVLRLSVSGFLRNTLLFISLKNCSSLSLYPTTFLPVCLLLLFFFFCSGRPFQCEIKVYAPWQSDTTHSPGPAPSGFNLIWSEKKGCVCVVVRRWRRGYWVEKGGKMKACHAILCWIVSPSFILPKLHSCLLTRSINSSLKW